MTPLSNFELRTVPTRTFCLADLECAIEVACKVGLLVVRRKFNPFDVVVIAKRQQPRATATPAGTSTFTRSARTRSLNVMATDGLARDERRRKVAPLFLIRTSPGTVQPGIKRIGLRPVEDDSAPGRAI